MMVVAGAVGIVALMVVVVIVVVLVFLVVMVMIVVMFVFLMVLMCFVVRMRFFFGYGAFYLTNPSGRSGHPCIVETAGTDNLVEVYLGIVAFNDFRTGL